MKTGERGGRGRGEKPGGSRFKSTIFQGDWPIFLFLNACSDTISMPMDIATYGLRWPMGQFSKTIGIYENCFLPRGTGVGSAVDNKWSKTVFPTS